MSVISEKLEAMERDLEKTLIELDCKMANIKNQEVDQAKNDKMKESWEKYQKYKIKSDSNKRIHLYNGI